MNIFKRKQKLLEELEDKEYREAFVNEHIDTGIPFQLHALREHKDWTQKELGEKSGMAQESISRSEDPNYGKFTLKTLKRLASAFDVALIVRFAPISELVEYELNLNPQSLHALSYEDDSYFKEALLSNDFKESVKSHIYNNLKHDVSIEQKEKLPMGEVLNPKPKLQAIGIGAQERSFIHETTLH